MTFYFYDLETSGVSPRRDRVMQFAGQRTDMDLKPIGEPDNFLIKLSPDVLPDPYAILVTGITPQKTLAEGVTESEFLKYFSENITTPDTITLGYNSIRFDDEFMRFMLWRNFYDAYEWQWKNNCSRWDLLDVVRMTRALRPEGITWPYDSEGKPSNKLEFVAAVNKLEHANAHDALSDVQAVIDVARLIKSKQPRLFDYLLNLRGKSKVTPLVTSGEPLVYTSGRYPSEYQKTTIAVMVAETGDKRGALMYDLRVDPEPYLKLSPAELASRWQSRDENLPMFPVKLLSFNRCPAIAPMSVLDEAAAKNISLSNQPLKYLSKLHNSPGFGDSLKEAFELMGPKKQGRLVVNEQTVDEQLYDGFVPDSDKLKMSAVRAADHHEAASLALDFKDERLKALLPLYKARNFPGSLTPSEHEAWEKFRKQKLLAGGENSALARYQKRLEELASQKHMKGEKKYLLDELKLYAEALLPA